MEGQKRSRLVVLTGAFTIIIVVILCWKLLEYVSGRILIREGLLSPAGTQNSSPFNRGLSLWAVSENTPSWLEHTAYNENLEPDGPVYIDENGFITGDTAILLKQKPKNTIRIFLTGGSAMFGSLQSQPAVQDSSYPMGQYTYSASIAGRLKKILHARYPKVKFEVVNAAVVSHLFNQNLAMYFERFHDFKPDIIINMDGFNDIWIPVDFAGNGDPYLEHTPLIANQMLDLEMLKRSAHFGNTWMLLNSFALKKDMEQTELNLSGVVNRFWHVLSIKNVKKIYSESQIPLKPDIDFPKDSFKLIDPFMRQLMTKDMWLIRSYEQQLANDSIFSIFCWQPLLTRRDKQKELSQLEMKLRRNFEAKEQAGSNRQSLDSLALILMNFSEPMAHAFNETGEAKYYFNKYLNRYFINDYICPQIDSIVRASNGIFIDMNARMIGMSSAKEFYMDYCHLTPYGTQFVTEQFADEVSIYMKSKHIE